MDGIMEIIFYNPHMSNYYKVGTICPAWMINIQRKRGLHYCRVVFFEDWGIEPRTKDHGTDAKQTHGYIGYLYRRTEIYEHLYNGGNQP